MVYRRSSIFIYIYIYLYMHLNEMVNKCLKLLLGLPYLAFPGLPRNWWKESQESPCSSPIAGVHWRARNGRSWGPRAGGGWCMARGVLAPWMIWGEVAKWCLLELGNHRKTMGKPWENPCKTIGKP